MENVVCRRVPVFASFRESGKKVAGPGETYEVKIFSHGLHYADIGADAGDQATSSRPPPLRAAAAGEVGSARLPPRERWVNIRSLGAKGDGATDDTEAFRKAIAEHRTIYLPSGNYVVSDTIALKPDTVLIGLHPSTTQIDPARLGRRRSRASARPRR